ncbi:hypothetical protein BBK36DRAFT_1143001 [Trichoderma citrinoviride]|uniref:Uncharacterized protein n=1 Tax=Trichoderma citrinoviride TaxID=58853 RepID=A0A2T4B4C5_9HYPO|nr:hypothetical protein BBK36DRAFT_1143001 [Trichoderma citrinoviride]PTB64172.1 hypothetical protein BBK36DRAFT_1143001 [Trichoderma citrinoviride]
MSDGPNWSHSKKRRRLSLGSIGDWCVVGGYRGGEGQSGRVPLLLRVGGTWGGGSIGLQGVREPLPAVDGPVMSCYRGGYRGVGGDAPEHSRSGILLLRMALQPFYTGTASTYTQSHLAIVRHATEFVKHAAFGLFPPGPPTLPCTNSPM